jgi:hypothetical protein
MEYCNKNIEPLDTKLLKGIYTTSQKELGHRHLDDANEKLEGMEINGSLNGSSYPPVYKVIPNPK